MTFPLSTTMAIFPVALGSKSTLYRLAFGIVLGLTACCLTGDVRGQSPTETPTTAPSAITQWAKRLSPSNWKMPSMRSVLPGQDEQDRIIERKDGLMTEVAGSAQSSWQRTKSALNPMNILPAGNRQPASETKKPGFFSRLFSPPAPEQTPGTVTDFLKQDRVRP